MFLAKTQADVYIITIRRKGGPNDGFLYACQIIYG